ncbi:MAG: cysteine desulfurase [Acidobacteria bacterium]|nr:cysteine desulfurase [Acidobacteriota bacterium]
MSGQPRQREDAYLDHAATTTMRPEAIEAMLPWMTSHVGNASGAHRAARLARVAIDDARDLIADLMGGDSSEIVFTSGGTEADNLAVFGAAQAIGGAAVASTVEHPAVLACVEELGGRLVAVDHHGVLDIDMLGSVLGELDRTAVVSVMTANNETGVVQPLAEIAAAIRSKAPSAVLHTDAVQAFGWIEPDGYADADLVSISAHKFGGPQGVGCLLARRPVVPRQVGGGQERELRSGTHNVAGIVAMATAAMVCAEQRANTVERVKSLRDRFVDSVTALDERVSRTLGDFDVQNTLPGHAHVCVEGVDSETFLLLLEREGVLAAAASSCASGAQQSSHVLSAMGVEASRARGALRFTLGWSSTDDDVDRALAGFESVLEHLSVTL